MHHQELDRFKEHFKIIGWAEDCNFKNPIWEEYEYELELKEVLIDMILLEIE